MPTKTYQQLTEELDKEQLTEFRMIRAGAALLYANQVKIRGTNIENQIKDAKSDFIKAKKEKDLEAKLNHMIDGMESLSNSITQTRFLLGSLTAINVVSSVLAERSNKQLTKVLKGKRR